MRAICKLPFCEQCEWCSRKGFANLHQSHGVVLGMTFYFPEAMFTEAVKQNQRGFGAHVWASMYYLDPQVAVIVNHNIQVIIAQYVLGRRSHFGSYGGLSLCLLYTSPSPRDS